MRYASSTLMGSTDPFHEPRRKFTADEVYRMLEAGILEEGPGLELLEGDLVIMSPQGAPHSGLADFIRIRLEEALGAGHYARTHCPVDAGPYSQPEPDVALVRGRAEDFLAHHPTAEQTLLVVEIARSSRPRDRKKAPIYARAGFPEYWLFDLEKERVEVYRVPEAGHFRDQSMATKTDLLRIPASESVIDLAVIFALLRPG
jgi:Uma2 family endonuclease